MKKSFITAVTLIHILLIDFSMIMVVAMLLLVFANVVLRAASTGRKKSPSCLRCGSYSCRSGSE